MKKWLWIIIAIPLFVGCTGIDFYYKDSGGGFYGHGRTISIMNNAPGTSEAFINGINTETIRPGATWSFSPRTQITVITFRAMTIEGLRFSNPIIIDNNQDYISYRRYNSPVYINPNLFDYALLADAPSP